MDKSQHSAPAKTSCIIHMGAHRDGDEHLISPQSYDLWLTLLEAAKVRDHTPLLNIAKQLTDKEIPNLYNHRKCRSLFTMKRDLEGIKRRIAESVTDEDSSTTSSSERPSKRLSTATRVYDPICIFCKKDKYQKHSHTREKLTQAVQLRADQTLRDTAIQKGDDAILAVTSRDIIAAEAHYHVSCYKIYTKPVEPGEKYLDTSENMTDYDVFYQRVEKEAYSDLLHFIKNDVIPNKEIVQFTSLAMKLESFMQSRGVEHLRDSTKKHIRRKLECELGASVDIFPDDKGKLLVIPGNILLKDLVLENQKLLGELKTWKGKSTDINKIIDQTSSHIRSVIRQDMKPTPWPVQPSDVSDGSQIDLPNELERLLVGLLTGDTEIKNQSQRINTLVQFISQDLIYAVTCGIHKPPKHILLPNAVKTLTGNVELIQTLNRLGHGVSYTQLEENDTALCLQKLATALNHRVALPASIKPYVFTNLAWDNIHRLEETLTGKGTSHRVNGIVVQPNTFGPHLPRVEFPRTEKLKQRSVSIIHEELEDYIAGTRVGPQPLSTSDNHFQETKEAARLAHRKNMVWVLVRQTQMDNQTVPGWTGFNICTRDQVLVSEDNVGYLPTINAPATELTTVFEILKQSEQIREELLLKTVVVVLDQALYAKATEIAWKHKERFSNILLIMGTFHTICNALSILGKRFRDAGLKDICIEAGIVAEGSINGVLEGKHYNRVVFDTYKEVSIKNTERSIRGYGSGHQLQCITGTQIVRQWREFLSSVNNKSSLIAFLVGEWMKPEFRDKLQGKLLHATVGDKCFRITSQNSVEVAALCCQHEEADGRLLFHAANAAKDGYQAVVICSEDTDVFILSLAFQYKISVPLFQKCGTKTKMIIFDISKVAATIGIGACKALTGMHAYIGCDTVSAFAGKGKISALKILTGNRQAQETFQDLGQNWDLSEELMAKQETFTSLLYAPKAASTKVNCLRYDLFCARKGELESHQLPPCRDCLVKHAQRANYQAAIWRRCLDQNIDTPSPVGRGWQIEKTDGFDQLVVHWMDGQPAPEAVLDLLACSCARKCVLPKCVCLSKVSNSPQPQGCTSGFHQTICVHQSCLG